MYSMSPRNLVLFKCIMYDIVNTEKWETMVDDVLDQQRFMIIF